MFAQSNAANSITRQNDSFDDDDSDHENDADESLVMTTILMAIASFNDKIYDFDDNDDNDDDADDLDGNSGLLSIIRQFFW